jgi:hypothetical protein
MKERRERRNESDRKIKLEKDRGEKEGMRVREERS